MQMVLQSSHVTLILRACGRAGAIGIAYNGGGSGYVESACVSVAAEPIAKETDETALIFAIEECVQYWIDTAIGSAQPDCHLCWEKRAVYLVLGSSSSYA